ncbi:MAG TPA: DUF2231 domain-containing protein [Longimicrobium sp.]|nr:DUF2231 domain-containing protein [Longimicrobium sp.]
MTAHVWLAHFPVALIVTGAAADVLGAVTKRPGFRTVAGALLMLGAAAALLSFLTGQGALMAAAARIGPANPHVEAHTQWGGAGVWPLAASGLLRVAWRDRVDGIHGWVLLAAAVVSAALVLAIVASGVAISHG